MASIIASKFFADQKFCFLLTCLFLMKDRLLNSYAPLLKKQPQLFWKLEGNCFLLLKWFRAFANNPFQHVIPWPLKQIYQLHIPSSSLTTSTFSRFAIGIGFCFVTTALVPNQSVYNLIIQVHNCYNLLERGSYKSDLYKNSLDSHLVVLSPWPTWILASRYNLGVTEEGLTPSRFLASVAARKLKYSYKPALKKNPMQKLYSGYLRIILEWFRKLKRN